MTAGKPVRDGKRGGTETQEEASGGRKVPKE